MVTRLLILFACLCASICSAQPDPGVDPSFLAFFLPPPPYTNVTGGLTGWWRLDDGSGTIATDSSGNGFNGTNINTPTWTNGIINGALRFASGSSQYVNLGSPALFPTVPTTNNFSIAAWVQVQGGSSFRTVFSDHDTDIYLGIDASARPYAQAQIGATLKTLTLNAALAAGWHQLVYTKSSTAGLTLYSDLASTNDATSTGGVIRVLPYGIAAQTAPGLYWSGALDEVRTYNRVLNSVEVTNLFYWRP